MEVLSRSGSGILCLARRRKNSKDSEGNMRIADVLSDSDDEIDVGKRKRGELDPSLSLSSSARSLISRLFSKNYSLKITKRKKKDATSGPDAVVDEDPCVVDPPASSVEAVAAPPSESEGRGSSAVSVDSGAFPRCSHLRRKQDDLSFNLGMGVGLVFLLAKSASEFNKMTELRADMEMLLKEIKYEVRRKDAIGSSSELNNNISFSPSHCCGDADRSETISIPNCNACIDLQDAKCDFEFKGESNYATAFTNTRSLSMNQMEAELEVELQRLQHNLEGDGSLMLQHRMKVNCENDDSSFDSFSINCEEEINEPKDDNHQYHGVCARELERRLHQLLEMRQQERIAELESALECAEKNLREKEMELQWWKETHWVASQSRAFI